jgi:hypothetical protein
LYDRGDSLVLQGSGRGELGRVATMLAVDGLAVGQTRGTANAGRVLEQNKVLRWKLCWRAETGEVLRELRLRSLSRQAG